MVDPHGYATRSASQKLIAKRTHRKSRAGCRNCKARRVKCDEAKPLCGQCARHYVGLEACDYDDPPPPQPRSRARRPARGGSAKPGSSSATSTTPQPLATLVDPFESLPAPPANYAQDDLLQYYRSHLVFKCFPFFACTAMVEAWFDIVSNDPLLTRIAMSTTALQLERKLGRHELYSSTQLTFDCVGLLQERLDDDMQAVSNETLIAVSQLIALENDTGNVKTVRLHMQALFNMVNLRGGLDLVSRSSPIAASVIFWTTMVASSEPSRLPFRFQLTNRSPPWDRNPDPPQLQLASFGIDPALAALMADVSNLYLQIRDLQSFTDSNEASAVVTELCLILQSLVIFESRTPSNFALTESCRQASILYIFYAAQGFYPTPALFTNAVNHGLKTSIAHALEYIQPDQDCSLLAWTTYVGCVASSHLPEHRWFIEHLAFLLDHLGIASAEQLQQRLAYVVDQATFTDAVAFEIWKEVEGHMSL